MKTVKDLLKEKGDFVARIDQNDSCLNAIREMNMRRISYIVVMDKENVLGIFTARDVLKKLASLECDPESNLVKDAMTSPIVACRLETTLDECREVMSIKQINHLPVLEGKKLVGIITGQDLLYSEIKEQKETIEQLNVFIHST